MKSAEHKQGNKKTKTFMLKTEDMKMRVRAAGVLQRQRQPYENFKRQTALAQYAIALQFIKGNVCFVSILGFWENINKE